LRILCGIYVGATKYSGYWNVDVHVGRMPLKSGGDVKCPGVRVNRRS
jgi:hypothetical protein